MVTDSNLNIVPPDSEAVESGGTARGGAAGMILYEPQSGYQFSLRWWPAAGHRNLWSIARLTTGVFPERRAGRDEITEGAGLSACSLLPGAERWTCMRLLSSIVRLTDRICPHAATLVVIASVSVGAALAEQAASPPAQSSATGEALIAMNFSDVELRTVIEFISEVTGRNFVFDDRVRGKITILAPQKMSVYQAYATFQSALYIAGFTTVPSGAVIKIVPVQEAKSSAIETIGPGDAAVRSDMIVTELFALKNVDVKIILPIVQPLVSPDGTVVAYGATNTLVIVDSAANVDRLHGILDALDVPEPQQQLEVLRLRNTSVTELAPVLQQVLDQ
jgi:hypothetical protein